MKNNEGLILHSATPKRKRNTDTFVPPEQLAKDLGVTNQAVAAGIRYGLLKSSSDNKTVQINPYLYPDKYRMILSELIDIDKVADADKFVNDRLNGYKYKEQLNHIKIYYKDLEDNKTRIYVTVRPDGIIKPYSSYALAYKAAYNNQDFLKIKKDAPTAEVKLTAEELRLISILLVDTNAHTTQLRKKLNNARAKLKGKLWT
jgi:hypothetical protein